MPKYSSNLFQGVQKHKVDKSTHDLSHEWKHDFNPGDYVPCLMIPTLPGDEIEIDPSFFFKFEPMYYPMIHRMKMDWDCFWVSNRLMWPATRGDDQTGWENWIMLKNETEHPRIDVNMELYSSTVRNNSIMGYLGIPYLIAGAGRTTTITNLNAFAAMAYLMIWDQYYRDPQLEDERSFPLVAGDNTTAMIAAFGFTTPTDIRMSCLPAKWDKDYFTSARPEPQEGDAVQVPLINASGDLPTTWRKLSDGTSALSGDLQYDGTAGVEKTFTQTDHAGLDIQENAATIKQWRTAEVLQTFREMLMKIGQRYKDWILGTHNEDPVPGEIGIPIMIGNVKATVQVSEVLTQAFGVQGDYSTYTGDYAGNASLYQEGGSPIKFKCPNYGVLMAILNVMPNTGYGQGIDRWWRYSTPYDYPLDIFSTVGDQEILKEEVMYNNLIADAAKNQETFGYIPKYSEARWIKNNYGSNNLWGFGLSTHLGRWWDPETTTGATYDNTVELDEYFINAAGGEDAGNIRISDVFRVMVFSGDLYSSQTVMQGYIYYKIRATRPIPLYSTPGIAH